MQSDADRRSVNALSFTDLSSQAEPSVFLFGKKFISFKESILYFCGSKAAKY